MKYKRRDDIFTISAIFDQIIEYAYKHKRLPKTIYLPPEEYVYLPYLLSSDKLGSECYQFMGIPIKMYFDKQNKKFNY